jgi:hypothetical protein
VVVYEKIVTSRVGQGVPAFLVSIALVLPLTVVLARVFARVFERQPWRRRNLSPAVRGQRVRVDGALG